MLDFPHPHNCIPAMIALTSDKNHAPQEHTQYMRWGRHLEFREQGESAENQVVLCNLLFVYHCFHPMLSEGRKLSMDVLHVNDFKRFFHSVPCVD